MPHILKQMILDGHEVGSHYNLHDLMYKQSNYEIAKNLSIAKESIFKACGQEPIGFRAPVFSITPDRLDIFEEINKFYYENYKIEWRITDTQKFRFDKNINNLSSLFSLHKKEISKLTDNIEAEVVLAIVERDIKGIGIAATFSNVVMVSDASKFKNHVNSVVVAHEFGHLFGTEILSLFFQID